MDKQGYSKLSINLTECNRRTLDKIKKDWGWHFGYTINYLINTFGNIPHNIKDYLLSSIKTKLADIQRKMRYVEGFELHHFQKEYETYHAIAILLNDGQSILCDTPTDNNHMQKITLKEGYMLCPSDWIIINPDDAPNALWANVIECRNHTRYHIPHFVYFITDLEYYKKNNKAFEAQIHQLCEQIYPPFKRVLQQQINDDLDVNDPDYNQKLIEWENAPTIGHFPIYVQADNTIKPDYEPPFGAKIIR